MLGLKFGKSDTPDTVETVIIGDYVNLTPEMVNHILSENEKHMAKKPEVTVNLE